MRNILALLTLIMFSMCASALSTDSVSQAGFGKLNAQQQAEIIKSIADKAAAAESPESIADKLSPDRIDKFVDLGERIGKMMGGAAKEVGIAVNEFVKTPVGQLTMWLIIWNYMGGALVHIAGGLLLLVSGISMVMYIARRISPMTYKYDPEKTDKLGRSLLISKSRTVLEGGEAFLLAVAMLIVFVASFCVMLNF